MIFFSFFAAFDVQQAPDGGGCFHTPPRFTSGPPGSAQQILIDMKRCVVSRAERGPPLV